MAIVLAVKDARVWALFVVYAACFGVELTINNIAAIYFFDRFSLDLKTAGLIAGLFGLMNIFARTLGGVFSDWIAVRRGLSGRVWFMGAVLLLEGLALILFARMSELFLAVAAMVVFSLFVQMSEGATYAVVPFINRKAVGSVAGIVGAGGNAGAVAAGFLFRRENLPTEEGLLYLGIVVALASCSVLLIRFSPQLETEEREALQQALALRGRRASPPFPIPEISAAVVSFPKPLRGGLPVATVEELFMVKKYTGLNRFRARYRVQEEL